MLEVCLPDQARLAMGASAIVPDSELLDSQDTGTFPSQIKQDGAAHASNP
jgi:hypothetical protein